MASKLRALFAMVTLGMMAVPSDAEGQAPELREFLRHEQRPRAPRFFAGEGVRRCAALRQGGRRCRNAAAHVRGPLAFCQSCARRSPWRVELSRALCYATMTDAERTALRDWLAQETPARVGNESAAMTIARMLRVQRQG